MHCCITAIDFTVDSLHHFELFAAIFGFLEVTLFSCVVVFLFVVLLSSPAFGGVGWGGGLQLFAPL